MLALGDDQQPVMVAISPWAVHKHMCTVFTSYIAQGS